jgi:hypothetical protein
VLSIRRQPRQIQFCRGFWRFLCCFRRSVPSVIGFLMFQSGGHSHRSVGELEWMLLADASFGQNAFAESSLQLTRNLARERTRFALRS